jgi:hypothetical protein
MIPIHSVQINAFSLYSISKFDKTWRTVWKIGHNLVEVDRKCSLMSLMLTAECGVGLWRHVDLHGTDGPFSLAYMKAPYWLLGVTCRKLALESWGPQSFLATDRPCACCRWSSWMWKKRERRVQNWSPWNQDGGTLPGEGCSERREKRTHHSAVGARKIKGVIGSFRRGIVRVVLIHKPER